MAVSTVYLPPVRYYEMVKSNSLADYYRQELDACLLIKASGNGDDELDAEIAEIRERLDRLGY